MFTNTACTWNSVLTMTWTGLSRGTVGLGSLFPGSSPNSALANDLYRQFIPEAFLWDTFYHLVEAAVAMRSGTGDWEFEIVHRDLKPANGKIFHANPQILEDSLNMNQSSWERRIRRKGSLSTRLPK